ncbi:MAG: apolipoprotein N-acyltransferase [Bacteroidales bacterium]|nr:apolipoprotein N-acyltransferase [Bacteroidales bacterium]MBN2698186.1 apolipoprotein N-acyltransferase [Bacteroidales bacterium]
MKNTRSLNRVPLAVISGSLLSLAFYHWCSGVILMVALVPLLLIEHDISEKKQQQRSKRVSVIWYAVLAFALFNILTSYWVRYAAWIGIIGAVIVNTTLMTFVFWLFHITKRRLGSRLGYASLVIYWVAFEFLYLNGKINFPWLLLGNGFANDIGLIQWYEVTGTLGGTAWVLVINILLFRLLLGLLHRKGIKHQRNLLSWTLGVILLPTIISLVRFYTYEEEENPYEIVVLQPNIDPYMKFADMPQEEQTRILLRLADSLTTPGTDYIVGPETAINNNIWEHQVHMSPDIMAIREFLKSYPKAKFVLGATTYKLYDHPSEYTKTSRPIRNGEFEYDSFNSAFQMDSTGHIPFYHKSKLVVGVEFMPFTNTLKFLENVTVRLGGVFRSNGTQAARDAFISPQDGTRVGPVICWESVFGEYVTDYVKEAGANFLFVITNDGWWGNTPGHRQHNSYAHLRAIETRRSIARSANTGISSMINQKGEEIERIGWWTRSGMRNNLNANDHITFYVKYGDYLGRLSVFLGILLLLYTTVRRFLKR